ncbi:MAG TPA: DUF6766 family protein, partial [Nocardioides sp.]|nr:DUF6766 family protein [Nocardioides sp.]
MRKFLVHNSLSLVFGLLFLGSLVGQALAGWKQFNDEQLGERLGTIGFWDYITSADFAVDVSENWQSEFLQFLVFLVLTVWVLQAGSPESKELDKAGLETKTDQLIGPHAAEDSPAWAKSDDWRTVLYSNSLALLMAAIFLASWLAQSVAGWAVYNETRLEQLRDPIGWSSYLLHPDFWARTLQNWQSEFLAVGSFAVLAIYLRQRG